MTRKNDESLELDLWDAEAMKNGPAKCAVLEEIVRRADARNMIDLAFPARLALIEAATFSGAPDKALVAFSWCLSQADKHPDQFPESELFWKFKWIVNSLGDFPQISRKQIEDMLDEMARRYERAGISMRPVWMARWKLAIKMGEKALAKSSYKAFRDMPRDWMSDCPACEMDEKVNYANFLGLDELAVQTAEPIIGGRLSCAEVPHLTYGRLLMPLYRLGRLDEARQMHRNGYRLVSRTPAMLDILAEHLLFLAITDNLPKATKLFEKHLIWALEATDLGDRFLFCLSAKFLMERLQKAETPSLKLRLPTAFPLHHEKGLYEVGDLLAWLTTDANDRAAQFDRRNGNAYHAGRVADAAKWHELVKALPIK